MSGKYYSVKEAIKIMNEENFDELSEVDNSELEEDEGILVTGDDIKFEQAMIEFFNDLNKDIDLTEAFNTKQSLFNHFRKHCLAGDLSKKSKRVNVYYDFNKVQEYKAREEFLTSKIQDPHTMAVNSLQDKKFVLQCFRKFFEGNKTLIFSNMCGLTDEQGNSIYVVFNSFATDVTRNYINNTVDYMISQQGKTRTLFPMDLNYLENKFNSVVQRTFPELRFEINR